MKPKTKLQKRIVGLSKQLKPHKVALKKWGKTLHPKYFMTAYEYMHYCLNCGHKWKGDLVVQTQIIGDVDCPGCKSKLFNGGKNLRKGQLGYSDSLYFAKIECIDEFQVVRMFWSENIMRKNKKARYLAIEVMQHWIDPDGRITSMSKSVHGYSGYIDAWQWYTKLEIRTKGRSLTSRIELAPSEIYPEIRYTKLLHRNGFKGNFHDCNPHYLFSLLLKDNFMESLWKQRKYGLVREAIRIGVKPLIDIANQIKIANKNNYNIKGFITWRDYIRMIHELGKDINNPKYVCPENFNEAHDRATRKLNEIRRKQDLKEKIAQMEADNIAYQKKIKKYLNLKFELGDLVITPIKTIEEVLLEAEQLKHCVFTGKYAQKENSLLLSAKIKDKHIETIEVSLNKAKIIQARGRGNRASKHNTEIRFLVNKHMKQIIKIK